MDSSSRSNSCIFSFTVAACRSCAGVNCNISISSQSRTPLGNATFISLLAVSTIQAGFGLRTNRRESVAQPFHLRTSLQTQELEAPCGRSHCARCRSCPDTPCTETHRIVPPLERLFLVAVLVLP